MKLENFRIETEGLLTKAVTTVVWENSDRPKRDIYFATTAPYAKDISCNPHAFLLACVMPAMRCGEDRIWLDAEICPELKAGLETVIKLNCHWYGGDRRPISIEASSLQAAPIGPQKPRAGFFFSGGVDSLATLRGNRLRFPPSHPGYIRDGFLIYGIEGYESGNPRKKIETFNQHIAALDTVAKSADVELIPVYTNVKSIDKDLEEDWIFWEHEFQGTVLAAVAHTFSPRISQVFVASSCDIKTMEPLASHPLTDPNFSSCYLRIHHDNFALSRFDKVKLIADWPEALNNLKVCFLNQPDLLNCGVCEKCLRTMTALVALGKLEKAAAFKQSDIDPDLLERRASINSEIIEHTYIEMIEALNSIGRVDLVQSIHNNLDRFHERDLKGRIKKLDRVLLGGHLSGWKKRAKAMVASRHTERISTVERYDQCDPKSAI